MADEKLSTWHQCKEIAQALNPGTDPSEVAAQRVRSTLLKVLASTGQRGVVLAAKLSRTNGPIPMEAGDMEVFEALEKEMKQRIEKKTGLRLSEGQFSFDASL